MGIRDELLDLQNGDGLLFAETVVDWARTHPESALHQSIEWDDAKAAADHRLWQVRRLIAIHVISDTGQRQVVSLSIDRTKEGGGYRAVDDVLLNKSLRDVLLDDALKELDRIQGKYERLKELADVWARKDEVKTRRRRAA